MLVGVLTVLGSSLGWLGARFKPRLLAAYLAVGSLSTLLQLIILLTIFFAQAKIAATIQAADHLRDSDRSRPMPMHHAGQQSRRLQLHTR